MIIVRNFDSADTGRIAALHRTQGLDYALPDLEARSMLVRTVIEENGIVTHALFLRKTAEAYWIFDHKASSRKNTLGRMLMLEREVLPMARGAGFEDIHAFIPPELAEKKSFDQMLLNKFKWERMLWPVYRKPIL